MPYKFPQYQISKTSFWQFLCCYMLGVGQNNVSTLAPELDASTRLKKTRTYMRTA